MDGADLELPAEVKLAQARYFGQIPQAYVPSGILVHIVDNPARSNPVQSGMPATRHSGIAGKTLA